MVKNIVGVIRAVLPTKIVVRIIGSAKSIIWVGLFVWILIMEIFMLKEMLLIEIWTIRLMVRRLLVEL